MKRVLFMKNRLICFSALLVLILLLPAAIQAQMAIKQPILRADIPFAFVAAGVHLPAGQYIVYHPGDPYLVVIEKDDGRARAMTYIHPSSIDEGESATKLVFNKYGDQHFLAQVWTERDPEVHQCFKCHLEEALLAQVPKPETIVIAAK
jgi:hypothetical protein